MNATPTPSQRAAAAQFVSDPSRWTAARSKISGERFWIVAGSKGTAYYASPRGCTCPGYTYRGCCSHQIAAQMREG